MKTKRFKCIKETIGFEVGKVYETDEDRTIPLNARSVNGVGAIWIDPTKYPEFFQEVDGRWKPEKGEEYWCIEVVNGREISWYIWEDDDTDNINWRIHNCFKTEKEAKHAVKKIKELLKNLKDL